MPAFHAGTLGTVVSAPAAPSAHQLQTSPWLPPWPCDQGADTGRGWTPGGHFSEHGPASLGACRPAPPLEMGLCGPELGSPPGTPQQDSLPLYSESLSCRHRELLSGSILPSLTTQDVARAESLCQGTGLQIHALLSPPVPIPLFTGRPSQHPTPAPSSAPSPNSLLLSPTGKVLWAVRMPPRSLSQERSVPSSHSGGPSPQGPCPTTAASACRLPQPLRAKAAAQ